MWLHAQAARDNAAARIRKNVVDPFSSRVLAVTVELDKAEEA